MGGFLKIIKYRHIKTTIAVILLTIMSIYCNNNIQNGQKTVNSTDFFSVTVLKQQYLSSAVKLTTNTLPEVKGKPFTGGLINDIEIYDNKIEYPSWSITLPVDSVKITQNSYAWHMALDFAQTENNNIYSVDKGKVIFVGWLGDYGKHIEILHENGFISTYSHLNGYKVKVGDEVIKGQLIGKLGNTGNSTGPHLHFEIMNENRQRMNPNFYLFGTK